MSIMNGPVHISVVHPEPPHFGPQKKQLNFIRFEGASDGAVLNDRYLIVAGKGKIRIFELTDPKQPKEISSVSGIAGIPRQFAVSEGFGYLTARTGGIYVCDVRDPYHPVLAHHIDSVELATGLCVSNGLLGCTNRHMGAELWDVRDPYHPVFLSSFMCGEAQSVWFHKTLALVGDWCNHRVHIFGISDTSKPELLSSFIIDGYADGVTTFERKGRLYAACASGHHTFAYKNRRKYEEQSYVTAEMLLEGYGGGHGLEIFDISDPEMPEFVSSVKFPPLFGGLDSWRVRSDGDSCYAMDSMNGFFEIDLSDLLQPRFTASWKPPVLGTAVRPTVPMVQMPSEFVTGMAKYRNTLYAMTPGGGIYVFDCESTKDFTAPSFEGSMHCQPETGHVIYRNPAQIHSIQKYKDRFFIASGEEGIIVLDAGTCKVLDQKKTKGICYDLVIKEHYLITAEGQEGLACYRIENDGSTLTECSRSRHENSFYREVIWDRELLAEQNEVTVELFDFKDGMITMTDSLNPGGGCMYFKHISKTQAGKYILPLIFGKQPMLVEVQETEEGRKLKLVSGNKGDFCPFVDSDCGMGESLLINLHGKYYCIDHPEEVMDIGTAEQLQPIEIENLQYPLEGNAFLSGKYYITTNRYTGLVSVIDVKDPHKPECIFQEFTGGPAGYAQIWDGKLYVALGHDGLAVYDL